MASASRATARISPAEALFAMRYSGSSRASAFFAGSSDGKTLSVIAMSVRAMDSPGVIAGLVPAISVLFSRDCQHDRDARVKPAHDVVHHSANTSGLTQLGSL